MIQKYKILFFIGLITIFGSIGLFLYFKNEKVYISKDYNPKTKITETFEYVIKNGDTILNGRFSEYNEKGIKLAEGFYIDNEIKGKYIHYYDNGNVETIQIKANSKTTIEGLWYLPNGQLDTYAMYNEKGQSCFLINFDKIGVTKYKGNSLLEINQNRPQFLKVGDILNYKYLLANIPNAKRSFKIENVGIDNTKIKRTISKKLPVEINVEEVLTKKGINTISAIVQYKFNDKITPILNDTITFNVFVK